MDARAALLAERVAEAADAWLRDPQDVQIYGRLVAATLGWRRGAGLVAAPLDPDPADADDGASPATVPPPTVILPPRVGDTLGELVAGLKSRQTARPRPPDG